MMSKKHVTYVKESFVKNMMEVIKIKKKIKDQCHFTEKFRGAAHNDCNLRYKLLKDIPMIIYNASYDTPFIINQLAEEFKNELNCIGENMEKYIDFSVPFMKKNVIMVKKSHIN